MKVTSCLIRVLLVFCMSCLVSGEPVVLDDFEALAGWKATPNTAGFEKAETAAVGKGAIRVALPRTVFKQISRNAIEGSAAWDRYEGISFWVKGDGSNLFGSLAVGPRPYGNYTYVCYFPLKNTEWHKVIVPWRDLVPEGHVLVLPVPEEVDVRPADATGVDLHEHVIFIGQPDLDPTFLDIQGLFPIESSAFHRGLSLSC